MYTSCRGVANSIWNTFLSGTSFARPFGDAILDGVDFDIQKGSTQYWDDLVTSLSGFNQGRKIYLSAAPGCSYPDTYLNQALHTGLFDYVWIKFYNDQRCNYNGNIFQFITTWGNWRAQITAGAFFLGIPPATTAAASGFIAPNTLIFDILPALDRFSEYGGVMISSRFFDIVTGYSSIIRPFVRPPPPPPPPPSPPPPASLGDGRTYASM